jgi:hypothetical protein
MLARHMLLCHVKRLTICAANYAQHLWCCWLRFSLFGTCAAQDTISSPASPRICWPLFGICAGIAADMPAEKHLWCWSLFGICIGFANTCHDMKDCYGLLDSIEVQQHSKQEWLSDIPYHTIRSTVKHIIFAQRAYVVVNSDTIRRLVCQFKLVIDDRRASNQRSSDRLSDRP